jgi:diguanylate cyclase (GGDEF)-like protein
LLAGGEGACIALAEWIRRDIAALDLPHRSAPPGRVTVSIGVAALVPSDDVTPLTLIAAADAGLYRAKACGRNRTCLGGPGLMAAAS